MNELREFPVSKQHHKYRVNTDYAPAWDFFLSFNKDSDLYVGQQQGDNGKVLCSAAQNRFNALQQTA